MNLAFVSRERRDKQISVDRESYGDVTEADFWDIAGDVVGVVAIQCFGMLKAVAIANYRSLRHIVIPLQNLNVLTGANGSGKSSFYRALRLLADTAQGRVVSSLAREGGLQSTLWAVPNPLPDRYAAESTPSKGRGDKMP